LSLKCDILVSKFAFELNLYRYIEPAVIGTVTSQAVYNFFYSTLRTFYIKQRRENPVGLYKLNPVYP
jgi:hypothetical protein